MILDVGGMAELDQLLHHNNPSIVKSAVRTIGNISIRTGNIVYPIESLLSKLKGISATATDKELLLSVGWILGKLSLRRKSKPVEKPIISIIRREFDRIIDEPYELRLYCECLKAL